MEWCSKPDCKTETFSVWWRLNWISEAAKIATVMRSHLSFFRRLAVFGESVLIQQNSISVHLFTVFSFLCRNLVALSRQLTRQRATEDGVSLTGRHCLILCVLLLSQLLINYVFTWALPSRGEEFPSSTDLAKWIPPQSTDWNQRIRTEKSDQCHEGNLASFCFPVGA